MLTQKMGLDFIRQNIFVGIDVHLKSWAVTILTDNLVHKTFTQPACADTLSNYLNRNFLVAITIHCMKLGLVVFGHITN